MRWWHQFLFRLARIVHWREADQDLEEEIRSHIELETQDNIDRGMPPEQARRAAHIKFGSTALAKEDSRAVWGFLWAEQLWQDLRYGTRILAKSPGFTATAVISLALGIGATTGIYSIVDTIFIRPLPFPEQDRLIGISEKRLDRPEAESSEQVSSPTFLDWKKQTQSFGELAHTYGPTAFVLTRGDRAAFILTRFVSDGYLQMMGAKACRGRLFLPEDYTPGLIERGVLSYGAWQRLFGSDPSVVGDTIMVDGKPRQVIGVMCPGYQDMSGEVEDLWMVTWTDRRETRMWEVVGRLKPGRTVGQAQAELDVIEAGLARQYPEQKGYGARVQPLQAYLYGDQRGLYLGFFGAVVLVLMIACTNVANLLLARAIRREKEMAVRASLGAHRTRLVRQLLTESLLLSFLGAGLGVLLAYGGVRLTVHLSPEYLIPRASEIAVNQRILTFTMFLTLLAALLFGLFPALRASKPNLNESLKDAGRRELDRRSFRGTQTLLVVAQIALSLVLLLGAGLMIHNAWRVLHVKVGFNPDHLTQMHVQLIRFEYMEHLKEGSPLARVKPKAALTVRAIQERLKALPGVNGVSLSLVGVLSGCSRRLASVGGFVPSEYDEQWVCYEPVDPGYFRLLEMPILKGRDFTEGDSRNSPPVVIISQSAAQRYFPGQDPVGKTIHFGIWESTDIEQRQVVGVVGDVRWDVNRPFHTGVYYPYSQLPAQSRWEYADEQLWVTFLVRSATDPKSLAHVLEQAVRDVAQDAVIMGTETVDDTRRLKWASARFYTWLLAVFAGTAIVLAAVGVFGVVSDAVVRRTHEIGIRMALGANPQDVVRLILETGLRMILTGLAIGFAAVLGLLRYIRSLSSGFQVNDIRPTDPPTLVAVCLLLALVALLACYIPARRAARMNPLKSLRYE